MIKMIGEKEKFAIQYEVVEVMNQLILGRICYWIGGIKIGDFDMATILSDSLWFLPQIIKDNGNREHEDFFKMEKEKVYYLLGGQAYLDDYDKYEEIALKETWARFDIGIGLDVFSNTVVKLIDSEKSSRIVFTNDDKVIYDYYLDRGIVDKVFLDFYNEFNGFYEEQVLKDC